jgi:4-amino-4-deoxy-L-arabinose transferase-like glycosyltransferase
MAEITKPNPERPFSVPNFIWIGLGILTLIAYFAGLGLPLVGPDEPRYAQVAREMWEAGDWITPTLGGHTWFEKPALLYWLEIAAYNVFGVSEITARLGPALCGLGTVAAMYLLGQAIGRKELGLWLAAVSASTLGIIVFAHGASFDIVITFTLAGSLVGFFWYDQRSSIAGLTSFYVFIGLSLLAKGLIGIIFPFSIVTFYFVLLRRLPDRRLMISILWGTALALAIAAVWYVPVYLRNGWTFVDEFLIQHHFQRFLSNKYQHPQPFYFFLWVLPLMMLPWLPFAIACAIKRPRPLSKGERSGKEAISMTPILLFSLSWVSVPLVFFSLSGSKLPGYILPAVPGAVVLAAVWVDAANRRLKMMAIATATFALAGMIVLTLFVIPPYAEAESIKPLIAAADSRGMIGERVFAVHCVPHGAEFYAPGRLLRDANGAQKKLYSGPELKTEMERAGITHALVIITANYPDDITVHKFFKSEKLASNGELAIYSVELLSGPPQPVH